MHTTDWSNNQTTDFFVGGLLVCWMLLHCSLHSFLAMEWHERRRLFNKKRIIRGKHFGPCQHCQLIKKTEQKNVSSTKQPDTETSPLRRPFIFSLLGKGRRALEPTARVHFMANCIYLLDPESGAVLHYSQVPVHILAAPVLLSNATYAPKRMVHKKKAEKRHYFPPDVVAVA